MGALSIWHILLIVVVAALLFGGRGKISSLMGDFGKGLKAFKKGVGTEENPDGTASTTTATGEPRTIGSGTTTASSNTSDPVIKR